MNKFLITIESNSTLQRIIEGELKEKYPKIKPQIYIRKAWDAPQITEISINAANLLVSIISLVFQIKLSKINDSEIKIKVKNEKTNKELKIKSGSNLEINKTVKDFLKEG